MLNKDTNTQNKFFEKVEIIIFAIIAFLKLTNIYDLIFGNIFAPVFAITSILILAISYIIIDKLCRKASRAFLIISYIFLSVILMIDSVYFSYNYKFTSVANIKLIGYLDGVKDSLAEINPQNSLWMFFDIPIILIYSIFVRKRLKEKIKYNEKVNNILNALILFLLGFLLYILLA